MLYESSSSFEECTNAETVHVVANTESPSDSMAKSSMSCHISTGRRSIGASIRREDVEYARSVYPRRDWGAEVPVTFVNHSAEFI